jgi:hypothetical protein
MFMSDSTAVNATPEVNVLFAAFFLAVERLDGSAKSPGPESDCVAITDPAALECVLRHWTLGDSRSLQEQLVQARLASL